MAVTKKPVRRSSGDDEPKEITINKVKFYVVTPAQIRAYHIEKDVLWAVGKKFLHVHNMNWEQLYKAAGYDEPNKLDFAYPEDWRRNNPDVDRRFKKGDKAAWYYGGKDKIMGEPVWHSEVQHKIIALAKRKLGE
jgi:hypothetical protein